jgi:hypothetical protein
MDILLGDNYPKHYQIALTKAGKEMFGAELLIRNCVAYSYSGVHELQLSTSSCFRLAALSAPVV